MDRLRIALIGSRGIPASYGGFETLMEELAVRLAGEGHRVAVYCRTHYTPRELRVFKGVELVVLPTLRTKYLDTPVHTLLSCVHAASQGYDAALVVNSANAVFIPILQLAGIPTALNVDGIEKRRAKWGWPGRLVYALSERLATCLPQQLITDAEVIRDHYRRRYRTDSAVIAYGVDARPLPPGQLLARLGLESRRYFLYVGRLEPENNADKVVDAYRLVRGELPLVMVGGAPYARRFIQQLQARADERVQFTGAIYGEGYRELLSHALAYIQSSEVGGTHPALVEAMGYGNCVIANDTPEHREVTGPAAWYFDVSRPATLAALLQRLVDEPEVAGSLRRLAAERARSRYRWEDVAERYAQLFQDLVSAPR